MQKITPHLWYDKKAKEAADFYVSIFKDSRQKNITTIHNTLSPSSQAGLLPPGYSATGSTPRYWE